MIKIVVFIDRLIYYYINFLIHKKTFLHQHKMNTWQRFPYINSWTPVQVVERTM